MKAKFPKDTKWSVSFHKLAPAILILPLQTFKRALSHVCNGLITRMIWSDRLLNLWERGRDVKTAFDELEVWFREVEYSVCLFLTSFIGLHAGDDTRPT